MILSKACIPGISSQTWQGPDVSWDQVQTQKVSFPSTSKPCHTFGYGCSPPTVILQICGYFIQGGTAVENKILHLGKVMRRYPHLLSFFPRGLVQGKISLRKNKRTSGSRSHKSFLCSFVLLKIKQKSSIMYLDYRSIFRDNIGFQIGGHSPIISTKYQELAIQVDCRMASST